MVLNSVSSLFHRLNPKVNLTFLADTNNLLRSCYTERHRYYHNFFHLSECMEEAAAVHDLFENRDACEFALAYHDLYWIPNSNINEEMSADRAYYDAHQLGMNKEFCNDVRELILSTKHKENAVLTKDMSLIRDIDFCIMGKNPGYYLHYETGVKLEYTSFLTLEQFFEGRKRFLNAVLSKDHIFLTKTFQEKYEDSARQNLQITLDCYDENDLDLISWMTRHP